MRRPSVAVRSAEVAGMPSVGIRGGVAAAPEVDAPPGGGGGAGEGRGHATRRDRRAPRRLEARLKHARERPTDVTYDDLRSRRGVATRPRRLQLGPGAARAPPRAR